MMTFINSTWSFFLSVDPGGIDRYTSFVTEGYDPLGLITKIALSAVVLLINIALVFPINQFRKKSRPWIFNNKQELCKNVGNGQIKEAIHTVPSLLRENKSPFPLHDHRNKLNRLLIDNESFAILLLDSIAEAVCGFDMEWRCVFVNKSFCETLGFHNEEEVIGFNVHDLIHSRRSDGSVYPGHECRILNSPEWNDRKTYFGEELFFRRDGSCFPAECWVNPIKHDRETIGGVMSFIDITSKKNLQKETEELKDNLLQSKKFESVGKHVCNITHDFNNVLMVIRCYTELVLNEIDSQASSHEYLKNVIGATDRAQNLIKDIRLFSRPDNETKNMFPLVCVTRDVLQLIKSTMPENITIKESFLQDSFFLFGKQTEIFRVILNICDNAVLAMKEVDEGVLEVKIYHNDTGEIARDASNCSDITSAGDCIIEISDNGCGIEQNILDKIFEPYFTTKELQGGTGLGLSIVNNIVADHHGQIKVDSVPGSGTSFRLMFPYVENKEGSTLP